MTIWSNVGPNSDLPDTWDVWSDVTSQSALMLTSCQYTVHDLWPVVTSQTCPDLPCWQLPVYFVVDTWDHVCVPASLLSTVCSILCLWWWKINTLHNPLLDYYYSKWIQNVALTSKVKFWPVRIERGRWVIIFLYNRWTQLKDINTGLFDFNQIG